MTEKQLLLGVNVSTSAAPGADPVADARNAEDLGFDFVSASDHPGSARPSYETWTLLAWIAASTSRVSVLSRVLGFTAFNFIPSGEDPAGQVDRLAAEVLPALRP